MKELLAQIKSEFLVEYRSLPQTLALLLFMWSLAYIIYRVNGDLGSQQFNFIFWLMYLLVSINIAIKSASHAGNSERLFLYTLISPSTVLFSRILFNTVYLILMGLGFYMAMIILFFPQVTFEAEYAALIAVGAAAISSILSFTGVISSHLSGSNTALSILSIPLLIPVLILLNEMGANMLVNNPVELSRYIAVLGISLLSISLSLILFPYIWRE